MNASIKINIGVFLSIFCLVFSPIVDATERAELDTLNHYISLKPQYDAQKEARILRLQTALQSDSDRYDVYNALFEEYKSYNYDKALLYVDKLYDEAISQADSSKIAYALLQKGFAYLSAGLFKEGADLFEDFDTTGMSIDIKRHYCITYARLLYDMADYDHVGMTHTYNIKGNDLFVNVMQFYTPADTAMYWYCLATHDAKEGRFRLAIERLNLSLESTQISEHQKAINYSTIAYLYDNLGDKGMCQHYNILAAISDIKNSTKETVAMRKVAEMLYTEGNVKEAGKYIRYAMEDANFYNARHRQLEIGQILPIIEQENAEIVKRQTRRINIWMAVSSGLLLASLLGFLLLYKKNRALRSARQTIENMNESLSESSKIKEEYIGTLLCMHSDVLSDMEKYQKFVHKNAVDKRLSELLSIPKQFNAPRKREEFYKRFDEIFLGIYPHFVADFNALLRPEERIMLKEGELLNTDLRIVALVRLGISHNEVISQVLDYSVNTIYTYKTRLRNKTDLDPAEFHRSIMAL